MLSQDVATQKRTQILRRRAEAKKMTARLVRMFNMMEYILRFKIGGGLSSACPRSIMHASHA